MKDVQFSELLGKVLRAVTVTDDRVVFTCDDGSAYHLFHREDCCESVSVESVVGNTADLIGSPITMAEESSSSENPPPSEYGPPGSFTWTFYKLATIKGYVDIRWFGESNGYYSESVDFCFEAAK